MRTPLVVLCFTLWCLGSLARAAAPTITSFTPTSGPVGTVVTITGTNLGVAPTVKVNGAAETATVSVLAITIAPGTTTGLITVTTSGGTATSATPFTVMQPPTITAFTPVSGGAGTVVKITGTNFTGATAVKFAGATATTFTVVSATAITAAVPSGAVTGKITVITPGGTAISAANFTVIPPPTITAFTPTSGLVGQMVTITGTNFNGATAVKFAGTTATTFTVVSATSITAKVPTGATTGKITVTTPGGTASSATNFTVSAPLALIVSPTTVDSTYLGTVALHLTGISKGQTVWMRLYVDGNLNGVVDAGEPCMFSFQLTDGVNPTIGGSTYVPGDLDKAVNGEITTSLDIAALNMPAAAKYLFQAQNTTGTALATTPFTITPHSYGQSISGKVVDTNSSAIANAEVFAMSNGGDTVITTYSNAQGGFQLTLPAGIYQLFAIKAGYLMGQFETPSANSITLPTGKTIQVTLTLSTATRHLRGTVTDAQTGVAIPSMMIMAGDDGGNMAIQYSDTQGVFDLPVTPGKWGISAESNAAAQGYYACAPVSGLDTTTGDVTGIHLLATKGTALVYGYLKKKDGTPLPGVTCWLYQQQNGSFNYIKGVNSDASGKVTCIVSPGTYYLEVSELATKPYGYVPLSDGESRAVTVSAGQAGLISLPLVPITAHIQGHLTNNTGQTLPKLRMEASNYTATSCWTPAYPDADNNFDIGVYGGQWYTRIDTNIDDGYQVSPAQTITIADGQTITGVNFTISLPPPTITAFTPARGPAGQVVTITGTSFFSGVTTVKFAGATATTFTVVNATTISATVPSGAATGKITVTTPGGTATSAASFTVISPPTFSAFSPTSGGSGTPVTLTGKNFTTVTAVKFNGTPATIKVVSDTSITTTVPSGATSGKISITNPAGTVTSAANFTVTPTQYLPFTAGKKWTYSRSTGPNDTSTLTCQGPTTIQGQACTEFIGVSTTGTSIHTSHVYYANTTAGLVQLGETDQNSGSSAITTTLNTPPMIMIPLNAQSGFSWGQSVSASISPGSPVHILYAGVITTETVTVPAGTYQDCLKCEISSTVINSAGNSCTQTTTMWFAPNIGMVQRTVDDPLNLGEPSNTMKLTSVTP